MYGHRHEIEGARLKAKFIRAQLLDGSVCLNGMPKVNGRSGRPKQRGKRNSRTRELREVEVLSGALRSPLRYAIDLGHPV
jgi:hypothetical protein